jgi:hypothetical protein
MYDDRASHASLFHWNWGAYEETDNTMTKLMLNGFTTKTAVELIPLTKSWSNPAQLTVRRGEFVSEGYDATELAYHLTCSKPGTSSALRMAIAASKDSPVINPAFVVKEWGLRDAAIEVNGKSIKRGKDCRVGHRDTLEGTDLIVWIRFESTRPVSIAIAPVAD